MNRATITSIALGLSAGIGFPYLSVFFIKNIGPKNYLFIIAVAALIQFIFYKQLFSFHIRNSGVTATVIYATVFLFIFLSAVTHSKIMMYISLFLFNLLYFKGTYEYERYYYDFKGNDKTANRIRDYMNSKLAGSLIAFLLGLDYTRMVQIFSILMVLSSFTMINFGTTYSSIRIEKNIAVKFNKLWVIDYVYLLSYTFAASATPTIVYNMYGSRATALYTATVSIMNGILIPWGVSRSKSIYSIVTVVASAMGASAILFYHRLYALVGFTIVVITNYAIYSIRSVSISRMSNHKPLEIEYSSRITSRITLLPIKILPVFTLYDMIMAAMLFLATSIFVSLKNIKDK